MLSLSPESVVQPKPLKSIDGIKLPSLVPSPESSSLPSPASEEELAIPATTTKLNSEGVNPSKKVYSSILDTIGNTPLIKINKLTKLYGIECNMYVKCEFFNGGGSIKDRIALNMIESLERDGKLTPNSTIIEATSGNTGIGVSLVSLIKGYKSIIAMPERMSREKIDLLLAMGSDIIRTPNEAPNDSSDCHLNVCLQLMEQIEDSVVLNQLSNPNNPNSHYDGTGQEILDQLDGKVDMLVAGVGTGGTITGISKRLKESLPNVQVVGVDIQGSTLALPASLNKYRGPFKIEGIGLDIVPDVLDRSIIDKWIKVSDEQSFQTARQLIQLEGLLCGGSSGSAMYGALQQAKSLKKGQNCVVILPDSIRSYMNTLVKQEWLDENKLIDEQEKFSSQRKYGDARVKQLNLKPLKSISSDLTCDQTLSIFEEHNADFLTVITQGNNQILGVVSKSSLLVKCNDGRASLSDLVTKVMYKYNLNTELLVSLETKLSDLDALFENYAFAVVKAEGSNNEYCRVTKSDLLTYVVRNQI